MCNLVCCITCQITRNSVWIYKCFFHYFHVDSTNKGSMLCIFEISAECLKLFGNQNFCRVSQLFRSVSSCSKVCGWPVHRCKHIHILYHQSLKCEENFRQHTKVIWFFSSEFHSNCKWQDPKRLSTAKHFILARGKDSELLLFDR